MKYIAFTVKGLEEVAKQEIKDLVNEVKFDDSKDKRIIFETNETKPLTGLKTVDDICLLLAMGKASSVDEVLGTFKDINLESAKEKIENL